MRSSGLRSANTSGMAIREFILGKKGAQSFKPVKESIKSMNKEQETVKNDQARFLITLNIYLLYEPAIPHLGICQREK